MSDTHSVETDQAAREASGAHPYGRYLEEFEVGAVYKHWPAKTVTEADDHLFCLLTMNHHPLHINDVYAHESQQGRNVVVGSLVYSIMLGMSVSDVSGKAIANLATEELQHPAPVFHGDTLFVESEVLEVTPSRSKADRGGGRQRRSPRGRAERGGSPPHRRGGGDPDSRRREARRRRVPRGAPAPHRAAERHRGRARREDRRPPRPGRRGPQTASGPRRLARRERRGARARPARAAAAAGALARGRGRVSPGAGRAAAGGARDGGGARASREPRGHRGRGGAGGGQPQ